MVVLRGIFYALEVFYECVRTEYSEAFIERLEIEILPRALQAVYQIYCIRQFLLSDQTDFLGIKPHLILHYPHFIRLYGRPANWDTASFETAHKWFVKSHYRASSKRATNIANMIMEMVSSTPTYYTHVFMLYS
jgi:hypothetical protein